MYNYQKKLKIQKYKNLNQIKLNYKYLFFCRYFDLNSQEFITLIKFLHTNQIKFQIIKRKLVLKNYTHIGQGSLFLLYFNNFNQITPLITFLNTTPKVDPIVLTYKNKNISLFKLNSIFQTNLPLPYQLKHYMLNLYHILLQK